MVAMAQGWRGNCNWLPFSAALPGYGADRSSGSTFIPGSSSLWKLIVSGGIDRNCWVRLSLHAHCEINSSSNIGSEDYALARKAMANSSCATMRLVACQSLQASKYCTSVNSQWASNRIGNVPRSFSATRLPGANICERGGLRAPLLPKPEMVFPLPLGEKLPLKLVVCSLPVQAAASSVQIASAIFTLGTVFVLPVYTAMIFAPKWKWTKKIVESDLPFIVMSTMYIYLLALSWTPETAGCMFASKYLLPELPGITRMFSSTVAVASAWIHLLAVDLFCGRGVFLDGLQHKVETRHSLVLCLMMCPVGLISHFVTKAIVSFSRRFDGGDSTTDMGKVFDAGSASAPTGAHVTTLR